MKPDNNNNNNNNNDDEDYIPRKNPNTNANMTSILN